MKKRVIAVMMMVMVTVAAVVSGCGTKTSDNSPKTENRDDEGQTAETEKKEYVIGVAPKMVGSPYWDYANEGCKKAGEDLNVRVELQASTTASAEEQASIIDNYITMGVDAIVVASNDETTLLPALERASEAGIPIIKIGRAHV